MNYLTRQPTGDPFLGVTNELNVISDSLKPSTSQGHFLIPEKSLIFRNDCLCLLTQGSVLAQCTVTTNNVKKRNRVKCSPLLSVRSTPPFAGEERNIPQEVASSLYPSLFLPPLISTDYCWLGGPIRDANEERRPLDFQWCETFSHTDKFMIKLHDILSERKITQK